MSVCSVHHRLLLPLNDKILKRVKSFKKLKSSKDKNIYSKIVLVVESSILDASIKKIRLKVNADF